MLSTQREVGLDRKECLNQRNIRHRTKYEDLQ